MLERTIDLRTLDQLFALGDLLQPGEDMERLILYAPDGHGDLVFGFEGEYVH